VVNDHHNPVNYVTELFSSNLRATVPGNTSYCKRHDRLTSYRYTYVNEVTYHISDKSLTHELYEELLQKNVSEL